MKSKKDQLMRMEMQKQKNKFTIMKLEPNLSMAQSRIIIELQRLFYHLKSLIKLSEVAEK